MRQMMGRRARPINDVPAVQHEIDLNPECLWAISHSVKGDGIEYAYAYGYALYRSLLMTLGSKVARSLPPHRFFPTRIALEDTRNPVSPRAILAAQKMVVGK